ncbi:HET-domain-containing protein [Xylaria acuta]|nr:HET-domain-containing protein [Xylaria acuta]
MWLINVRSLHLKEFIGNTPSYAILSHTWDEEEVTFQEMSMGEGQNKKGYRKIRMTCEQAIKDNIDWAWVDTCCIDKKSSAELSEAINSMFHWYESATVCYTYLADVVLADAVSEPQLFLTCRWVTRGWTLQELLAPRDMVFYDSHWNVIGNKFDLSSTLGSITRIYSKYIDTTLPLSNATVAEKMSWAGRRKTTREEDGAYCLLGIFGVNMPLLYGERGEGAFIRLQQEILSKRYDPTIFDLEINPDWPNLADNAPTFQNGTLRVTVPVIELASSAFSYKAKLEEPVVLALFGFRRRNWGRDTLGLILRRWGDNLYCRNRQDDAIAVRIPVPDLDYLKSHTKTICIKEWPSLDPATRMELRISKKLLELPYGFQLQTIAVVPPTTYDASTRWLLNISEREEVIFALIYSNPSGYRFALTFAKLASGVAIIIRPHSLDRLVDPSREDSSDSINPHQVDEASDQGHRSSKGKSRRRQPAQEAPKILRVFKYKLESYIQDLGGKPELVHDIAYAYMVCPIVLQINKESKVMIYKKIISARDPEDDRIDSYGISCCPVADGAFPNWSI